MSEAGQQKLELKPVRKLVKEEIKKKSNWSLLVLLAVTLVASLVFYGRSINWRGLKINFDWSWLTRWSGARTVRFEK